MAAILSFFFNLFTSPLGLPIHPIWEYLILLIIGGLAFLIAYYFVGILYSKGIIGLGVTGSIIHWIIRFLLFIVLWAIAYGLIASIRLITTYWVMVLSAIGVVVLLTSIILTVILIRRKKANDA